MKTAPIILVFSLLATGAQAAVTNVAWYRLGENDPGAASGLTVTNPTIDIIGSRHLAPFGAPVYTDAVSSSAASRLGSSLAAQFNGASQYVSNAVISTATDNFGLEAWVNPDVPASNNRVIAFNGNSLANGWGFFHSSSGYFGLLAGVTIVGVGPATPGQWTHLALVRNNGLTTFYVNGVSAGSSPAAPNVPVGGFAIGARPVAPAEYFDGAVDEARVFTFAAGQFSTNELLLNVSRVATLPATDMGPTNATLNGRAHPVGFPTSVWFEWGTTTNYGNITAPQQLGSGISNTNFSAVISGLAVDTTYHFRAVASNVIGVAFGTNQSFTVPVLADIGAGLPGVQHCSVAWGDYDSDGRLDILLTGETTNGPGSHAPISQVWRNIGNGFTNIAVPMTDLYQVSKSSVAWGDYDNDGQLDIVYAGEVDPLIAVSIVLRNITNGFASKAELPGASESSVAWGDYDNDGRLDVLLTGMHKVGPVIGPISQIWRNMGTGFTQTVSTDLPGVFQSSAAWGDYDNDGRLDILITGRTNLNFPSGISQVWRNTGSGFTNINAGLPGVYRSSVAWGDYDSDGRLDILLTGDGASSTGVSQVWRNTGNGFTNISAGLPGVFAGSAIWGDYDNDGRLDILLNGYHFSPICQIWRNTGSGFININPGLPENVLPGVFTSSAVGVTTTTTGGWTFCSLAEVLNLPGSRCFLLPKYGAIGRRSPIRHQLPQPVWRRPLSVARSS